MEDLKQWGNLEIELSSYSNDLVRGWCDTLLDAFANFTNTPNIENVPVAMIMRGFYAAIADLDQELSQDNEQHLSSNNGTRSSFSKLPLGAYFIHGGMPCKKTSNNYSLDDFNALDLFRGVAFGVPASRTILHTSGELEQHCKKLHQRLVQAQ